MGTISLGQIIIISLFLILIFGDISKLIKKFQSFMSESNFSKLKKKNKKKKNKNQKFLF